MSARRLLDQWARMAGFADFSTFLATGGTTLDAKLDIGKRLRELRAMLAALDAPDGDPVGGENAQIQGDDDVAANP